MDATQVKSKGSKVFEGIKVVLLKSFNGLKKLLAILWKFITEKIIVGGVERIALAISVIVILVLVLVLFFRCRKKSGYSSYLD